MRQIAPIKALANVGEAEAVRSAWRSLYGIVPRTVNTAIEEDRFLDATIDLARAVIGEANFSGWRATFTSSGPPYTVTIFLRGIPSPEALEGRCKTALSTAFIDAIGCYRGVRRYP